MTDFRWDFYNGPSFSRPSDRIVVIGVKESYFDKLTPGELSDFIADSIVHELMHVLIFDMIEDKRAANIMSSLLDMVQGEFMENRKVFLKLAAREKADLMQRTYPQYWFEMSRDARFLNICRRYHVTKEEIEFAKCMTSGKFLF